MKVEHDSDGDVSAGARLERALERLNALVNWERRDRDASMRRGIDPIRDILSRVGNPERRWRAVHVAGTKGKGTTSALIASALVRGGLHVGLYTSPHVVRIHERIRIDGRDVEDGVFASALERVLAAREQAIAACEPVVEGIEPALDTRRLGPSTRKPTPDKSAPAVDSREAALDSREPALDRREPALDTRGPALNTRGPALNTREPALDRREPALDSPPAGAEATWFDLMTAAAFLVFAEAGVEWGVIECGLGGRLDSTNAIDGEVCVITNIDLEHTAVLGNTRAAIAREKAGIVKPGSTLVTGVRSGTGAPEDDAGGVIQEVADRMGVRVLRPERAAPTMLERNLDLARLVLDELGRRGVKTLAGKTFSPAALDEHAIEAARLSARLEKLWAGRTRVVLDAAHVASSVRMVLDELALDPELGGLPTTILALGRDKDVTAILKTLAGRVDRLVCTTVASGPLADAGNLAKEAERAGIEAETAPDPSQALARALDLAQPEGWVLVIGSFYLAGSLRSKLGTGPPAAWKTPRC